MSFDTGDDTLAPPLPSRLTWQIIIIVRLPSLLDRLHAEADVPAAEVDVAANEAEPKTKVVLKPSVDSSRPCLLCFASNN